MRGLKRLVLWLVMHVLSAAGCRAQQQRTRPLWRLAAQLRVAALFFRQNIRDVEAVAFRHFEFGKQPFTNFSSSYSAVLPR